MRLVVFGPTGGTGRQLVTQALEAGYEVTAVARRPAAVTPRHPRLTIVEADALAPGAATEPVSGADAVISALGVHRRGPTTLYSAGIAHILDAMQGSGAQRLVCVSSAGVTPNPAYPPAQRLLVRLLVNRLYPHLYGDMRRMETRVRASSIDWTLVRAPALTDGPATGKYVATVNRHPRRQRSLSRADVAGYILDHLHDRATYRAWVELAGVRRRRSPRS